MKVLIVSDTHGHEENFEKDLEKGFDYRKISVNEQ